MNFKELINTEEYDFLRAEPILQNMMYLTLGGSHAYGTNIEGSDVDIRGVTWEGKDIILGMNSFEQYLNEETDTTIYGLTKFVNLMLNSNPNIIEMVGTEEEHILYMTKEFKMLRDNYDLFLSKKAINSFCSYATAQLRRLENALARDEYPEEEKEIHILKSLESNMSHLQNHYVKFEDSAFKLRVDKSIYNEELEKEILLNVNLKDYPLRDFKNICSEMTQTLKNFGKLNHRNRKKNNLHLAKHSMHLIRLYLMLLDVLTKGKVITFRPEQSVLLKIRNLDMTLKESQQFVFGLKNDLVEKIEYAIKNTELREKPDYKKINELLININMKLIKSI